jgi:hypothetical protein
LIFDSRPCAAPDGLTCDTWKNAPEPPAKADAPPPAPAAKKFVPPSRGISVGGDAQTFDAVPIDFRFDEGGDWLHLAAALGMPLLVGYKSELQGFTPCKALDPVTLHLRDVQKEDRVDSGLDKLIEPNRLPACLEAALRRASDAGVRNPKFCLQIPAKLASELRRVAAQGLQDDGTRPEQVRYVVFRIGTVKSQFVFMLDFICRNDSTRRSPQRKDGALYTVELTQDRR